MIENKWLRGRMIGIINPKIKYFIIFILFFLLLSLPITFALEVHLTYDENEISLNNNEAALSLT